MLKWFITNDRLKDAWFPFNHQVVQVISFFPGQGFKINSPIGAQGCHSWPI
jgi:hypothetical protein